MTMSEQQRLEMHLGLRKCLGDSVADSVMEHLPQGGWSDVARTRDIDQLTRRIEILDGRIKLVIGGILTVGVALFALQVQVLLELAKL